MRFKNRKDAGKKLAKKMEAYGGRTDVRLFALPRGGVELGKEIAAALKLPLDVIITRKIGAPFNEEYAIGALAETGEAVWNESERDAADPKALDRIVKQESKELVRRLDTYRHGRKLEDLSGKTAVLIDDGVATGLTIRAAVAAAKHRHAEKIIIAVPHGAKDSLAALRKEVDGVVALTEPEFYGSVGAFYDEFPQVEDEEVQKILRTYGSH